MQTEFHILQVLTVGNFLIRTPNPMQIFFSNILLLTSDKRGKSRLKLALWFKTKTLNCKELKILKLYEYNLELIIL
jgi:hypothetical protein